MIEFKFQIGDCVQSKNGAMIGCIQERMYHEHPAGVIVKYYIYGKVSHKGLDFGHGRVMEEGEDNLEPFTGDPKLLWPAFPMWLERTRLDKQNEL